MDNNLYYTEEQMAKILNVQVSSLRSRHSSHPEKLPPKTTIGNQVFYLKESFEKFLKENERSGND